MTAANPIDWWALAQISGDDAATQREFLARFRVFNDKDQAALLEAAGKSDAPGMMHAAHRIKGAASTVGAMELAAAAESVELACREGDVALARSLVPMVGAALERLGAYMDSLALPSPPD
jgi:two-component system sensor histidine kinase/response regulator